MIIIIKPGFLQYQERILNKLDLKLTNNNFKTLILRKLEAEEFYKEHGERVFFPELVEYMTSGLCLLIKVEGDEEKIRQFRSIIGNTDPANAERGTLRATLGKSKSWNALHCSDSIESARREENFFDSLGV